MVLTALKIAGMILLVLFCVLLLCLLLLLFVPVRYRVDGAYVAELLDGTAELSWLFHAVTGEISYHHGMAVSGYLRIFGMTVYRIEGELS